LGSLRSALQVAEHIQTNVPVSDCAERQLIQNLTENFTVGLDQLAARLSQAISSFDLAPISTIHGFCQSLISRHALELGCDSDLEIVPNCDDLPAPDYKRSNHAGIPTPTRLIPIRLEKSPQ